MMSIDSAAADTSPTPRWRPLATSERRVLGVLVEKAKTTPENYPLSLNALRTGCNQKSNRAPLMQLEDDQVEEAIDSLRAAGAVAIVQGDGRVDKYRHLAYDWLGVEKVEMAVMAELLLRGAQTIGELRGRAARMEPIKDLSDLRPTLDSLEAKGLIDYLTPPGRGAIVTHTLYRDQEMEKLRREMAVAATPGAATAAPADSAPRERTVAASSNLSAQIDGLRDDLESLKHELQELRRDVDELNQQLGNS